jgi:hypothetical protein
MRVAIRSLSLAAGFILFVATLANVSLAQVSYTSQVRGVVTDQSGAVVVNAAITITNDATNIAQTAHTDDHGQYFFAGLRPAVYTIKAEVKGFRISEKKDVVLQVDQETSVDFVLHPVGVSETMEVTETAPLLDTESATIGTDITNEYVKEIPLFNRSFFGLAFLSGGVTEAAGSGATDNYPSGTNFVSNGQRNATAEVRIDGALVSAPEQGEGATSNVYYEPSVEIVQEFKVQNNSFSAEFGSNGGTVVNMVLKSGGNKFHGSGSYFMQRGGTDARDFFDPKPGVKPSRRWDEGGFSIGGPIKRDKTFFFFDFQKIRDDEPMNFNALVPTQAERNGDFTGLVDSNGNTVNIFDPKRVVCNPQGCTRPQVGFDINGNPLPGQTANVIPSAEIDPIGQALINLYPLPNFQAPVFSPNFRLNLLSKDPGYQFDIKVDHQLNDKNRLSGRYSRSHSNTSTPEILGDLEFGPAGDGIASDAPTAQNVSLEYTWTVNPRIILTNRFALDRVREPVTTKIPTIESFDASLPAGTPGLPTILEANQGVNRMPTIQLSGNNPGINLFDQCCVNTHFAHTLYSYSSQLVISRGKHLLKLGGEQRLFYNNFWQPPNPTGLFNFTDFVTSPTPFSNSDASGNNSGDPFASMLFGYADNVNGSSGINVFPPVANKSKETGFYFQDDWKVNAKLTLNLGIRYEWSTPYTERFNHIQFSDFNADSGQSIDLSATSAAAANAGFQSAQQALQSIGLNTPNTVELTGTTLFPTSGMRTVPVDRNNVGPRVGFAYQFAKDTVIRGGAGVYYGMNIATNYQYPGTAFRNSPTFFFTLDNFATQSATLANPLFFGLTQPEGKRYGQLAEYGFSNFNDLGTTVAQNADIYQWNLGIQRLLPSQIVLAVDYSANRSTHLPWGGDSSTRNRNFISSDLLAQISAAEHASFDSANGAGACDNQSCVSGLLQGMVVNPFCTMFGGVGGTGCLTGGPAQIFNEPDSRYGQPTLPLGNLLRPHPQFDGNFEGLPLLEGSSWYNSMQVRFQKRTTHHVSFEGSYTVSKNTDTSSAGRNAFVGTYNNGNPQQLDRLNLEHSISANDAPQRLAGAVVVELPVGRNNWIGGNMNRALDAVIGGWSLSTLVTEQSGQPMAILMSTPRLMDGNQRPSVVCSQLKSGISMHNVGVSGNGTPVSFFNPNCFADPGDQNPGNAPRYFSNLRTDGIHNFDMNFFKEFTPKEGTRLELRAEVFNLANHERFGIPDLNFGSSTFGNITGSAAGSNPRRFQFGARFEF